MDKLDSQILQALQDDFPICENPYDALAEKLGISCDQLYGRLESMMGDGVIRRVGASLDSRKFGFFSTLAAVSVEDGRVDEAAEVIGGFDEVTHSYLRKDEFNIWFTVIAEGADVVAEIIEKIRTNLSLEKSEVLNLPMTRLFKLDARFKLGR